MKSSEISTREATQILENIVVPYTVKLNILKIKQLLQDNLDLTKKLVLKCLSVGKQEENRTVFYDEVEDFIFNELKKFIDTKKDIFQHSFNLSRQICFDSNEIKQISKNHPDLTYEEIRINLETNINNLLESTDTLELSLIGDL